MTFVSTPALSLFVVLFQGDGCLETSFVRPAIGCRLRPAFIYDGDYVGSAVPTITSTTRVTRFGRRLRMRRVSSGVHCLGGMRVCLCGLIAGSESISVLR